MSTESRIVIVTGGNSGIGYETVKKILQSQKAQYTVLLGARNIEKANKAIDAIRNELPHETWESHTIEPLTIDLSSDESIATAQAHVAARHGRVDALINNAGTTADIAHVQGAISLRECFLQAYDTNVAGTNVVTYAFAPLLLKSSDPRLLFVGGLSQITQAAEKYFPALPHPAGWPKPPTQPFEIIGYRCSKVALNMLMLDWNHKLQADGVKVWSINPGMLATNLGGVGPEAMAALGAGHPSLGGHLITRVLEGERDADVGKFVGTDGAVIPW